MASLPSAEVWRLRWRTGQAMVLLAAARLLVALVPFHLWRTSLGGRAPGTGKGNPAHAIRLAHHVERAGQRLPFATKCLPRAMALSWMLRRRGIAHVISFAIRPPQDRGGADGLHAWVAVSGTIILGDLPGPWAVVHRIEG